MRALDTCPCAFDKPYICFHHLPFAKDMRALYKPFKHLPQVTGDFDASTREAEAATRLL